MVECFHEHFLSSECHKTSVICARKNRHRIMRCGWIFFWWLILNYGIVLIIQPTVRPRQIGPPAEDKVPSRPGAVQEEPGGQGGRGWWSGDWHDSKSEEKCRRGCVVWVLV